MDLKKHLSILNHFLIIYVERVKNGSFLKPTVLRFEPRLMYVLVNAHAQAKVLF